MLATAGEDASYSAQRKLIAHLRLAARVLLLRSIFFIVLVLCWFQIK
jgi:hypothetical protein